MEWIVMFLILYFIPSAVAAVREKKNAGAIFALNLLAGWTVVGWIISMVWALTHEEKRSEK